MSEEPKLGTKEWFVEKFGKDKLQKWQGNITTGRIKYHATISPLKKVSMRRVCLQCEKGFTAYGVPDGVRFIRLCLSCKHLSIKSEDNANKSSYVPHKS